MSQYLFYFITDNVVVPTLTTDNRNHFTESLPFNFGRTRVNIHPRFVTHVCMYVHLIICEM